MVFSTTHIREKTGWQLSQPVFVSLKIVAIESMFVTSLAVLSKVEAGIFNFCIWP